MHFLLRIFSTYDGFNNTKSHHKSMKICMLENGRYQKHAEGKRGELIKGS